MVFSTKALTNPDLNFRPLYVDLQFSVEAKRRFIKTPKRVKQLNGVIK